MKLVKCKKLLTFTLTAAIVLSSVGEIPVRAEEAGTQTVEEPNVTLEEPDVQDVEESDNVTEQIEGNCAEAEDAVTDDMMEDSAVTESEQEETLQNVDAENVKTETNKENAEGEQLSATAENVAAKIGNDSYSTLTEAVNAASSGAEIVLQRNVEEIINFEKSGTYTLNLNGFVIDTTNVENAKDVLMINANDLTLDIKDGTIRGAKAGIYGIYAYKGADNLNLTLDHVKIDTDDQSLGVQGLNSLQNVTLKDCELKCTETAVYFPPKSGTLKIIDSKIFSKKNAIVQKGGNIEISGTATEIYCDGPAGENDFPYEGDPSKPETFPATGNAIYVEGGYDDRNTLLTITGGVIKSKNNQPVLIKEFEQEGSGVKRQVEIFGGTFSSPVPEQYCAEGYVPVKNDDGTYGVEQMQIAQIGNTFYPSLKEAFDAVKDGETVKMIDNEELSERIVLKKKGSVTLDLNGKKISYKGADGKDQAIRVDGSKLKITDSTSEKKGTLYAETKHAVIASGKDAFFEMDAGNVSAVEFAVQVQVGASAKVAGGVIEGRSGIGLACVYGKSMEISGGTVTGNGNNGKGIEILSGIYGGENIESIVTVSENAKVQGDSIGIFIAAENKIKATLKIEGGSVYGKEYGIIGNGTNDNTEIIINGGEIKSDFMAISHPQEGDLTINNGEITAPNGVQYCGAGKVIISGGKITATGEECKEPYKSEKDNDGPVQDGSALSLVSRGGGYHSEDKQMSVVITGGTLTSVHNPAVSVYRIEKVNGKWVVNENTTIQSYLEKLEIEGGYFKSGTDKEILNVDSKATAAVSVSGGHFVQRPDSKLIKQGYKAIVKNVNMDGINYVYEIAASEISTDVVRAEPEVSSNIENPTQEQKEAITVIENNQDKIEFVGDSEEIVKILDALTSTPEKAKKLKEEALKAVKDSNLKDQVTEENVVVVISPYLDIQIEDVCFTDDKREMKLDITMLYQKLVTTEETVKKVEQGKEQMNTEGSNQNAVVMELGKELQVTKPVTITLPIPVGNNGFDINKIETEFYIKHDSKTGIHYYKIAEKKTEGNVATISFVNPHGFSMFTLLEDRRSVNVVFTFDNGTSCEKNYTPSDVGSILPEDTKADHKFIGWKFTAENGKEIPETYKELTDELLTELTGVQGKVTAIPVFSAITDPETDSDPQEGDSGQGESSGQDASQNKKPEKNEPEYVETIHPQSQQSPQAVNTGDSANVALWSSVLIIAAGAAIGGMIYTKRRKKSKEKR